MRPTILSKESWHAAGPRAKNFKSYLDKIAAYPKVKGIRRVLHTQPDAVGQGATFLKNVAALAEYGLSFDICVLARQLPIAINLVSQCPDVIFILDHCGVPQVKEKHLDPWRSHITEIARFPNVSCKISGLVAYADSERWTAEDLRPFVEHVIAAFGWDRVLFGSDWPVCTLSASYRQWVEALQRTHARSWRDEPEKAVLRQCRPRIPAKLKPKLPLNSRSVLSYSRGKSRAGQKTSVQANRKSCGQDLDPSSVGESLHHGKFLESLARAKLGPIQNFGAPDVSGV